VRDGACHRDLADIVSDEDPGLVAEVCTIQFPDVPAGWHAESASRHADRVTNPIVSDPRELGVGQHNQLRRIVIGITRGDHGGYLRVLLLWW
jgi:hypothetical protein